MSELSIHNAVGPVLESSPSEGEGKTHDIWVTISSTGLSLVRTVLCVTKAHMSLGSLWGLQLLQP